MITKEAYSHMGAYQNIPWLLYFWISLPQFFLVYFHKEDLVTF